VYSAEIEERNETNVPIARLGDVEIVFLHSKTIEEAKSDWIRRAKRVNYDNLIVKFSQQNFCSEELLEKFVQLPYDKKFVFTYKPYVNISSSVYFKRFEKSE